MSAEPVGAEARLPKAIADVVAAASGAGHRPDPVEGQSGGPAGNARLTAWVGLVLLAVFLAECVTLLSLDRMITLHVLLGAALVPLTVVKTVTTGWRIARYYLGDPAYRAAGPPPLLLRILGPLVVLTGLAVLGTGLALIALGQSSFTTLVAVAGFRIDALTLHQAAFAAWLVVTGLHVLGRTVPAVQLAAGRAGRRVPGRLPRAAAIVAALVVSVAVGGLVVHLSTAWTDHHIHRIDRVDGGRGQREA
jgi:hypothetical protein